MAFQPIVNITTGTVFAHEALVRGPEGQPAGWVIDQITPGNMYAFDQEARVTAIETAARLGLKDNLSINFLPNAVYNPETCIRRTIAAAERTGFPIDHILFEVTEGEQITDKAHLKSIIDEYQRLGFATAIDDFGSGYAGLNLLADFQPDIIKIDMELIQGISDNPVRRSILEGILKVTDELGIDVIAEGIETREDLETVKAMGVELFQGYLLAKPSFESLVGLDEINIPG